MPRVRMPDGVVVQFPDDMPQEQIKSMIASKFPDAVKPKETIGEKAGKAASYVADSVVGAGKSIAKNPIGAAQSVMQGISGGLIEPATGLVAAPLAYGANKGLEALGVVDRAPSFGETVSQTQQGAYEAYAPQRQLAKESALADVGLQVLGSAPTIAKLGMTKAGGLLKNAATNRGFLTRLATRSGVGAAATGAYSAGTAAPEDRLEEGKRGAVIGAAAANVMPALGAIGSAVKNTVAKPAIKTSEELFAKARPLYEKAKEVGGILKPEARDRFLDTVNRIGAEHPEAKALAGKDNPLALATEALEQFRGQPMTFEAAQDVDQTLTNLINKPSNWNMGKPTSDAHDLMRVQDALRDMIDNPSPDDLIGGANGFAISKQARAEWAKGSRAREIEAIIERANMKEQPATSLRNGFGNLINNKKRFNAFSKEEQAAIRKAADTGIVGNLFRAGGSGLVPYIASGIGTHIGGAPGAIVGGAVGYGLQQASKKVGVGLQMGRANAAARVVSNRGAQKTLSNLGNRTGRTVASAATGRTLSDLTKGNKK